MTYELFKKANDIVESRAPYNGVAVFVVSTSRPTRVELTYPTGAKEICNTCDALWHVSNGDYYIKNPEQLRSKWTLISGELAFITIRQFKMLIENNV